MARISAGTSRSMTWATATGVAWETAAGAGVRREHDVSNAMTPRTRNSLLSLSRASFILILPTSTQCLVESRHIRGEAASALHQSVLRRVKRTLRVQHVQE